MASVWWGMVCTAWASGPHHHHHQKAQRTQGQPGASGPHHHQQQAQQTLGQPETSGYHQHHEEAQRTQGQPEASGHHHYQAQRTVGQSEASGHHHHHQAQRILEQPEKRMIETGYFRSTIVYIFTCPGCSWRSWDDVKAREIAGERGIAGASTIAGAWSIGGANGHIILFLCSFLNSCGCLTVKSITPPQEIFFSPT